MERSGIPENKGVSGISYLIPETTVLRAFREKLEHRVKGFMLAHCADQGRIFIIKNSEGVSTRMAYLKLPGS